MAHNIVHMLSLHCEELIRWLRPLGRGVGASDHATALFCIGCGCVLGFCTLIHLYFVVVRHTLMIKHILYMWL